MPKRPSLVPTALIALSLAPAPAFAQAERTVTTFESGWRYFDGDAPGAAAADFADGDWEVVRIPHSWNRVGYYHHDLGGTNSASTVAKRQGVGWYRLKFEAPLAAKGQRNWLEFDAASRTAKIWLNGEYLGEHRGGFSRFRLDASAALRPGAPNILVVRVDNSPPAADGPNPDVLPLVGDFFIHGGLYRPVRLVTTAPLHFDMRDHGGPGVYATTVAASKERAEIAVRVRVANDGTRAGNAKVRVMLVDRSGREVASTSFPVGIAANRIQEQAMVLKVDAPRLWQGTDDPYLYDLVAEISGVDGKPLDRLVQPYGVRTMAFDPERGFLLNGQPYRLRGVGYHQDRDGKGWAISRADVEEDVRTLREMGANSIRLTHYQHGADIHDLADRAGLVVWDEIPLVSAWTQRGKLEPDPALVANARQQLTELIRQNRNHAASAIWGIANEVDFGNSLPAFLTGNSDGKVADPMPLLHQLDALAKVEDPSRPTALATCCEGRLFAADTAIPVTARAVDLGGANRYFGWYFGAPGDLGPHLDQLRAARPGQPLAVTEYGAGGALTIHTDNVLGGPVDARGRAQPEEYESHIHETALAQLDARPWLYATWLWNAFDFATTIRTEGDAQDINTKGLVAYDHRTRKDAYYFYKANWSAEPTVRITGRRHVDRAYAVTDVKVYSNTDDTELLLNGRSLGSKSACPQKVCIWRAVRLDPGDNMLVARGRNGGGASEDSVSWTLAPEKLDQILIDTGALVAAKGDARQLGSDNWFDGGTAATLDTPADYGRPAEAAIIAGTGERDALATYREGNFSYRIPVPEGRYRLTLRFATPAGQKPGGFEVRHDGKALLRNFQPVIPASGAAAEVRSFTLRSNGEVRLDFVAGTGAARVSLIELQRLR